MRQLELKIESLALAEEIECTVYHPNYPINLFANQSVLVKFIHSSPNFLCSLLLFDVLSSKRHGQKTALVLIHSPYEGVIRQKEFIDIYLLLSGFNRVILHI